MCGITGILQHNNDRRRLEDNISLMRDSMVHRGPDASGNWIDETTGQVALGHRRLSVVDLSERGAQPMASHDGRYIVTYNGEIYNFLELRAELTTKGHSFQGDSDTEVLLAAIVEWGFERALTQLEGMFALGVWDRADQCLYLARDRFGEKPLYYGSANGTFLFGSELKSFRPHPDFCRDIDPDALTTLLRYCYIPAPHCIFKHYWKLPPACFVRITRDLQVSEPKHYWDLETIAEQPRLELNDRQALEELEKRLSTSIRQKMIADVPVGAFLSGGVDSSLVVSLMRQFSSHPIKTFTIGFDDPELNEADEALVTAKHLGTDHEELYVSENDLMETVPEIPRIYDEPFADPSQIPTTLVSKIARRHVTVALSGDGGDELFGGYNRYEDTMSRWHDTRRVPAPIRRLRAAQLRLQSRKNSHEQARQFRKSLLKRHAGDLREFYRLGMSHWLEPLHVVRNAKEPATAYTRGNAAAAIADPWKWMTVTDALCYLPADILTKVDRSAMSVSLETRTPFLDSRLADFAFRLPNHFKYRDGVRKWLLRQLLYRYVPEEVVERPKRGFGVPLAKWLRGPLRDWGEELLDAKRLESEGYFNPQPIRDAWESHIDGTANNDWPLWNALMFQQWQEWFFSN